MGGFLCYYTLPSGHLRMALRIGTDIFLSDDLIPHTCRRIASVGIIQMIAVAAECVAERRRATELDGLPAWYEQPFAVRRMPVHDLFHIARTRLYGIPHLGLGVMVTRIRRVFGVLAVRPCLHPTELCVRLVRPHGINEKREPRFVRAADTAIVAGLLEGYEIIPTFSQRILQRDCLSNYPCLPMRDRRFVIRTHTMGIGGGVFDKELGVLLQRTTAIV